MSKETSCYKMNVKNFLHKKSKHKIKIIFYNYCKHAFHTKMDVVMNWLLDVHPQTPCQRFDNLKNKNLDKPWGENVPLMLIELMNNLVFNIKNSNAWNGHM